MTFFHKETNSKVSANNKISLRSCLQEERQKKASRLQVNNLKYEPSTQVLTSSPCNSFSSYKMANMKDGDSKQNMVQYNCFDLTSNFRKGQEKQYYDHVSYRTPSTANEV